MVVDFTFGKCKTRAAYSAKLKKQGKLNLEKIKRKYEVVMDTPILLVIKIDNDNKIDKVEVIVHQYGELIFKNCEDVEFMEKIAREIYEGGLTE